MAFQDFDRLTDKQRRQVIMLYSKTFTRPIDYMRRMFWVKPDGNISERNGHWQYTHRAITVMEADVAAQLKQMFGPIPDDPKTGGTRKYRVGSFSL